MKFKRSSLSFKEGILGILVMISLAIIFFIFFNIFWGILKLIYFLFARKVYFGEDFLKIYSSPIENWPKIKGYKIYPIYLLLNLVAISLFPWGDIVFRILIVSILSFFLINFRQKFFCGNCRK